jgi:tetratricopeptide (TPR) repeat protein
MSRQEYTDNTASEIRDRKVKLMEGAIVFVLVLGLCVYLGIRFAQDPVAPEEPVATTMIEADQTTTPITTEPAGAEPAAAVTDGGTEPAVVAETEPSIATPDERGLQPEIPLLATYSNAEETYLAGRYDEAAELFTSYCEQHPENAWGHYMHGLSLWKADRDEEAGAAFTAALQRKPDHLKSLVNLARVQLELDQAEAALASIEQAVAIAPDDVAARRVQGRVYHNLSRNDEAIAAYQQALERKADDAWTLNNLALIFIENEQFDRALAPLARAAELAPEVAVIRNNLGTALERSGHLTQARAQYLLASDLGHGRGEENHARLALVTIAADDPQADLTALAAAWTRSDDAEDRDPAGPGLDAVAALSFEEAEAQPEQE